MRERGDVAPVRLLERARRRARRRSAASRVGRPAAGGLEQRLDLLAHHAAAPPGRRRAPGSVSSHASSVSSLRELEQARARTSAAAGARRGRATRRRRASTLAVSCAPVWCVPWRMLGRPRRASSGRRSNRGNSSTALASGRVRGRRQVAERCRRREPWAYRRTGRNERDQRPVPDHLVPADPHRGVVEAVAERAAGERPGLRPAAISSGFACGPSRTRRKSLVQSLRVARHRLVVQPDGVERRWRRARARPCRLRRGSSSSSSWRWTRSQRWVRVNVSCSRRRAARARSLRRARLVQPAGLRDAEPRALVAAGQAQQRQLHRRRQLAGEAEERRHPPEHQAAGERQQVQLAREVAAARRPRGARRTAGR